MSISVIFSLLVVCSAVIHFTHAGPDTLKLFTVPKFYIDFTLNSPLNLGTTSSSQLIQFSTGIKAATSEHVFSFIESYLYDLNVNNGIKSVDLDVVVHNDWSSATIRSDIVGNIIFSSLALNSAGVSMTQTKVNDLIMAAFTDSDLVPGEAYPREAFLVTLQDTVPNVVAVDINFNDSTGSSSNEPPTLIYDNETLNAKNGNAGYMTVSVAAAVVVVIAGMFVYKNRNREPIIKDRCLLTNVDVYDEEHGTLFDPYESSYETPEGIHFIPVPAKKEDISKEHRKLGLVPKVYVQAASPTEFVYGAAFSHKDQAKVARAHGNRNYRPSKVGGKKMKKKSALKPLSAISETLEEEGRALVVGRDDFEESPDMEKLYVSPEKENDGASNEYDDFMAYDDSPLLDDTPCVSFSPVCDVDWSKNTSVIENVSTISPRKLRFDQDSERDALTTNSVPPTPTSTPEKDMEIDDFVDRLESLMAARARQYQERKHREKDLQGNEGRFAEGKSDDDSILVDVRVSEEYSSSNESFDDNLTYAKDTISKELFPSEIDEESIGDVLFSPEKESSIDFKESDDAVSIKDVSIHLSVQDDSLPEGTLLDIREPYIVIEVSSDDDTKLGLDPEAEISSSDIMIHEIQLSAEDLSQEFPISNLKTFATPTAVESQTLEVEARKNQSSFDAPELYDLNSTMASEVEISEDQTPSKVRELDDLNLSLGSSEEYRTPDVAAGQNGPLTGAPELDDLNLTLESLGDCLNIEVDGSKIQTNTTSEESRTDGVKGSEDQTPSKVREQDVPTLAIVTAEESPAFEAEESENQFLSHVSELEDPNSRIATSKQTPAETCEVEGIENQDTCINNMIFSVDTNGCPLNDQGVESRVCVTDASLEEIF